MITQSISVSSKESCDGGIGIYNEDHINYLSDIRETCHQNGTRFLAQLIYPGLAYHDSNSLDMNKISKDDLRKIRDDFIVLYRVVWNDCLDTDIKVAQALEKIGIELLYISSGTPMDRELEMPDDFHFNNIVYTGSQVKKHVNIPTIVVNDIRTFDRGKYLVNHDMCDFTVYGKSFLSDENFMTKSLENDKYE